MTTSTTPGGPRTTELDERYAEIASLLDEERRALLRELDHPGFADVDAADDPGGRLEALEVDQRRQADLQRRLADVEGALTRLGDDTYGRCRDCGATILFERLQALPTTLLCVTCAANQH